MESYKGIESQFDMDLKSKERVHDILNLLNKVPLDPLLSQFFTPHKKFEAWMAVYGETRVVMSSDEQKFMDGLRDELTKFYNILVLNSSIFQSKIAIIKAVHASAMLNQKFVEFRFNLYEILQRHKYFYKEKSDPGKALFGE